MVADPVFVKGLRMIDPELVSVWHPRLSRWQIRQWVLPHHHRDQHNYYAWRAKSALIRTVCYRDDEFYDIGYHPLDERVLYALKLSRHYSLNPEATGRMVDDSNKKMEAEWAADNADIAKETATSIYEHFNEKTVDLGGRSAR